VRDGNDVEHHKTVSGVAVAVTEETLSQERPELPRRYANLRPWKPGQSGNPAGRPVGARNKLSEALLEDLLAEWLEGGREAIRAMRLKDPAQFVRVAVMALPRQVKLEADEGPFSDMSNAELRRLVEVLEVALAAAGAAENGVEGEQAAIGPQPPLLLPAA
jgi:hypothetical protein